MATTARLDLSVWRNDDVYEFPLRVIGPNLTGIGMRAQVRLTPDTPGDALAILDPTTNGNAEGIRLVGVTRDDQGRNVNDVRLRINKSTRQALPYAGELGDAARLVWAFQINGITRITGAVLVLAHAIDSNNAPTSRAMGSSLAAPAMPQAGATLTIASDQVAELVIDGADLLGPLAAQAANDAALAATTIGAVNATLPIVAGAVIAARPTLLTREPVANDYVGGNYGGATVVARGADLAGGLGAAETWIETHAPGASTLVLAVYSRPMIPVVNDGAGHSNDRLETVESRTFPSLPGMAIDGVAHRVVIDLLRDVNPDPAKLYLMLIEVRDADGDRVTFSFLHGQGVTNVSGGYPQVNGYFRSGTAADQWTQFDPGTTAAFRWLGTERPGATALAAGVFSLGQATRVVPIGAPAGIIGATSGAGVGQVWWNEWPIIQGGLLKSVSLVAVSAGWVSFHAGPRLDDGTFNMSRTIAVYVPGAGTYRFEAGADFDAFTVEEGWYFGAEQSISVSAYTGMGNSWVHVRGAAPVYLRNQTLAVSAEIAASALPLDPVETKRRRVSIWREKLDSNGAPSGWDTDPAIRYSAAGLSLAAGVPAGWSTRVSTHRYVRAARRMTRARFTWTTAGARLALLTVAPPSAIFLDANNNPSGIEVDGVSNRLLIKNSVNLANGTAGDPGNIAFVDLGYGMTVGHEYVLEWGLNRTVHTGVLTDVTNGKRSPLLTSGDPAFSGIDTGEGTQNGALAFAFVAGNARITDVEVLYDAPSPAIVTLGDSITWEVLLREEQSWVSQIEAEGVTVLRSAQSGGTSLGALTAAWREIPAARPHTVIVATGTNDVMQNKPVADTRWCIASIIDVARRVGARIVLTVLPPLPGKDVTAHNAMIVALAAGQSDIDLWYWNKALTINGAGATSDPAKLNADMVHPNPAGAVALYLRLRGDGPAILD